MTPQVPRYRKKTKCGTCEWSDHSQLTRFKPLACRVLRAKQTLSQTTYLIMEDTGCFFLTYPASSLFSFYQCPIFLVVYFFTLATVIYSGMRDRT